MELSTPVIYGPVPSRRLGRSLGINLFSPEAKACSFDCVYCQCGKKLREKEIFFPFKEIRKGLIQGFDFHHANSTPINYITFAGNGEPTLHPAFPEVVEFVHSLAKFYFPGIPMAIFSNGTVLGKKQVRNALARLKRRILKLDAADESTFRRINQSRNLAALADNLIVLAQNITLEISTAVIDWPLKYANFDSIKSQKYVELVQAINPLEIHLYSIDRPPAYGEIAQIERKKLLELADFLRNNLSEITVRVLRSRKTRPWSEWIWE